MAPQRTLRSTRSVENERKVRGEESVARSSNERRERVRIHEVMEYFRSRFGVRRRDLHDYRRMRETGVWIKCNLCNDSNRRGELRMDASYLNVSG